MICEREMQPRKVSCPICVKVTGRLISVREEQPSKAPFPKFSRFFEKSTNFKILLSANALLPTENTFVMRISSKEQLKKAKFLMEVMFAGVL